MQESTSSSSGSDNRNLPTRVEPKSKKEIWQIREKLAKPAIQRFEASVPPKIYYAPEWELDQSDDDKIYNPLCKYGTTPEKWEYYNKVVWPINYVVPDTGLPKAREVFHCRESIHFSPKRMWYACQLARRLNVVEALKQLRYKEIKGTLILAEVLEEAMTRAKKEFHIEEPENMFVAEAFPIQEKIIKGRRRHARERWCKIRYRYIHVFVRLEEGEGPDHKGRSHTPEGWEQMENYYKYLRNRDFKYSL